jgi:hypothetical protein
MFALLFFVGLVVSQTSLLPHFAANFNGTSMMGTITTAAYNGNTAWDNTDSGSRSLNVIHLTKPLVADTTSLAFVTSKDGNKTFVAYTVSQGKCNRAAGNLPASPCPDPTFSASTWKGKACKAGVTTCTQSGITTTTTIYLTDADGLLASRSKTAIGGQQLVSEIDYYDQKTSANSDSVFAIPSGCPQGAVAHATSHVTGLAHHIAQIHSLMH